MSFPAGTYLGASLLVEATGIGPGTISAGAGGNTLAYTVTNAVNVPANTNIRLQIANANNPPDPSSSLTVSITTRDSVNAIIDGPTSTTAYNMKQVDTNDIANNAINTPNIANNAVTNPKIAPGAVTIDKIATNTIRAQIIQQETVVQTSVPPNGFATGTVDCTGIVTQGSPQPISGGYSMDESAYPFLRPVEESRTGKGWQVTMFNEDPNSAHSFTPIAQCWDPIPTD